MDDWYYKAFDLEFGPVPFEKLVELVKSHSLSRNESVRLGEQGVWRRIGSIGPLMAHLPFEAPAKVIAKPAPEPEPQSDPDVDDIEWPDMFAQAPPADIPPKLEAPKPVAPETAWWCLVQGREYGPLEFAELIEWTKIGRLRRDDQVRYGQDAYVAAGGVAFLFPARAESDGDSSPSAEAKSNTTDVVETVKQTAAATVKSATVSAKADKAPGASSKQPATSKSNPSQSTVTAAKSRTTKPIKSLTKADDDFDVLSVLNSPDSKAAASSTPVSAAPAPSAASSKATPANSPAPKASVAATSVPTTPDPKDTAASPSPANGSTPIPSTTNTEVSNVTTVVTALAKPAPAIPTPAASRPAAAPAKPAAVKAPKPPKPPRQPINIDFKAYLPIAGGVAGVVVLVGLIYLGIRMIPAGHGREITQLQSIKAGYADLIRLRDGGGKPSEADVKAAKDKILQSTKPVLDSLRQINDKNIFQSGLFSLAKKMDAVAKEEFTETKSKSEQDVTNGIIALERSLGMAK